MDIARTASPQDQAAKVVLHMHAAPGAAQRVECWIRDLLASAARSPGLFGSSVLSSGLDEYIVLLRFGRRADLDEWEASADVQRLMEAGRRLVRSTEAPLRRTGLETWFRLPGHPAPAASPPAWKVALVTWLALLPQVIALGFIVPKTWPLLLGAAVSTAIPVAVLTWFAMPRLTRLLYRWLYAATSRSP